MKRLAIVAVLVLGLAHCEDRLSTQEAYAVCEEERKDNPSVDGKVFAECVGCYENCEECQLVTQGNDISYKCPDQIEEPKK